MIVFVKSSSITHGFQHLIPFNACLTWFFHPPLYESAFSLST